MYKTYKAVASDILLLLKTERVLNVTDCNNQVITPHVSTYFSIAERFSPRIHFNSTCYCGKLG